MVDCGLGDDAGGSKHADFHFRGRMSETSDEMLTAPELKPLATEYFDNGHCFGAVFESAKGWNGKHAVMVKGAKSKTLDECLAECARLFREWEATA